MAFIIRRSTGSPGSPGLAGKVRQALQAGPATASQLARRLGSDEIAITRIIRKEFALDEPGPAKDKSLEMTWVPCAKDSYRAQETLYTVRKVEE